MKKNSFKKTNKFLSDDFTYATVNEDFMQPIQRNQRRDNELLTSMASKNELVYVTVKKIYDLKCCSIKAVLLT